MSQNLLKPVSPASGEDMAGRWLMRNIRVELNHADYCCTGPRPTA